MVKNIHLVQGYQWLNKQIHNNESLIKICISVYTLQCYIYDVGNGDLRVIVKVGCLAPSHFFLIWNMLEMLGRVVGRCWEKYLVILFFMSSMPLAAADICCRLLLVLPDMPPPNPPLLNKRHIKKDFILQCVNHRFSKLLYASLISEETNINICETLGNSKNLGFGNHGR